MTRAGGNGGQKDGNLLLLLTIVFGLGWVRADEQGPGSLESKACQLGNARRFGLFRGLGNGSRSLATISASSLLMNLSMRRVMRLRALRSVISLESNSMSIALNACSCSGLKSRTFCLAKRWAF